MKARGILAFIMASHLSFCSALYGQEKSGNNLKFNAGILTGYKKGYGFQGNFTARNFENDFPFQLRFGLG
jgi:hypothetical protein